MTYEDAVNYIKESEKFGSILGLSRMRMLCEFLNNPQEDFFVIHVAGTNGKGSVSSMISSILTCSNVKCAMYSSPSLTDERDHFRINGEIISRENYVKCVCKVRDANRKLIEETGFGATVFELETALAFVYFSDNHVDAAVIECGLGGRDDATNVITRNKMCVFTSISLDHTAVLGNTIAQISNVKSGIINCNCPVVCYDLCDDAIREIRKACNQYDCLMMVAAFDQLSGECDFPVGELIDYKGIKARINLTGVFQRYNACVAIEAAFALRDRFDISDEDIIRGLSKAQWSYRFEKISDNPPVIVDGAHNPGAADELANTILSRLQGYDIIFVLGMFKDKDCNTVLSKVLPLGKRVITITTTNKDRAAQAEELAEMAGKYCPATVAGSIEEAKRTAVCLAQKCSEKSVVIAFGSLSYLAEFVNAKS